MSRRPTLGDIESRPSGPETRANALTAHRRRIQPYAEGTGPNDCAIGQYHRCWCGIEYPHDWPGKSGGAPHPRQESAS